MKTKKHNYEYELDELFKNSSKYIDPKVQKTIELIKNMDINKPPKHKVFHSQTGTSL